MDTELRGSYDSIRIKAGSGGGGEEGEEGRESQQNKPQIREPKVEERRRRRRHTVLYRIVSRLASYFGRTSAQPTYIVSYHGEQKLHEISQLQTS